MSAKSVMVRLAHELIPAPTLGRLVYLKRAIRGPRSQFIGDCARLSKRVLSPKMHLRARRIAIKLLGRPSAAAPAQVPQPIPVPTPEIAADQAARPVTAPLPVPKKSGRAALKGPFYYQGTGYETLEAFTAAHGLIEVDMAIISAFLGRFEVLDLMAREATSLPEGYTSLVCLVGSSDEDRAFLQDITARNPSVLGMIAENKPVGRKWQSAVDLARATSHFDLLAITGSDDILPQGTITAMIDRNRLCLSHESIRPFATALYGTMEWLILSESDKDAISPQLVKCSYKLDSAIMPLGAGRFYSRQIIDHFDGDIFDTALNRLLDDKGFYKVHRGGFGVEYFNSHQGAVLSVKGNWGQMNSFDAILGADTVETVEFSFEGYAILQQQLSPETFEVLFGSGL